MIDEIFIVQKCLKEKNHSTLMSKMINAHAGFFYRDRVGQVIYTSSENLP